MQEGPFDHKINSVSAGYQTKQWGLILLKGPGSLFSADLDEPLPNRVVLAVVGEIKRWHLFCQYWASPSLFGDARMNAVGWLNSRFQKQ